MAPKTRCFAVAPSRNFYLVSEDRASAVSRSKFRLSAYGSVVFLRRDRASGAAQCELDNSGIRKPNWKGGKNALDTEPVSPLR